MMKLSHYLLWASFLVLLVGLLFKVLSPDPMPIYHAYPATIQKQATHMITYYSKTNEYIGECSGLSIGAHSILTAEHCDDGAGDYDYIQLDLTTHKYHVLATAEDDRDHQIYLMDGPGFTNFYPVALLENVNPAKPGESVYVYGCGESTFPPRRLDGRLDTESQKDDASDLDHDRKLYWYTMPIVEGDSGAPIFGSDGRVLGLMTWRFQSKDHVSAGTMLGFSDHVLQFAVTFDVANYDKEAKHGNGNSRARSSN
jgi:hypothetical protein